MGKHSAKFQINLIKDVAGVAGTRSESARAITPPKMAKTRIKAQAHLHIIGKQYTKFQINLTKDAGGVVETIFRTDRRMDGWTDHTQMDENHFYSPPCLATHIKKFCGKTLKCDANTNSCTNTVARVTTIVPCTYIPDLT